MTEKSIYNDNEKIENYCIEKYIRPNYDFIPKNNLDNYITLIISDILKYYKIPPETSKTQSKWKSIFCCCK